MQYGQFSGSRSPALRDYLDQRRQNVFSAGNRFGAAPQSSMPLPSFGGGSTAPAAPAGSPRMAPTYQTSGAGLSPAPAPTGKLDQIRQAMPGGGAQTPGGNLAAQVAALPPEYQKMHNDYISSLYAGGDYEGRHELNQMLSAQYAQLLARMANQPKVDFSGSSQVADQFTNQREQLMNALAARGIAGSGVEAGALANSYGSQGRAMGQFFRDALEQRRRENNALQDRWDQHVWALQNQGLQKNWQEQADPGFWGDVAGVLGGVAGAAIPGIGGAIGKGITGLFGANQQPQGMYGGGSIYGPPAYPPVDWNDPYARGY